MMTDIRSKKRDFGFISFRMAKPPSIKKIYKKLKADKDFYERNSTSSSVVSALVLNACLGTLMADVVSTENNYFKSELNILLCAAVAEGISLVFGKLSCKLPRQHLTI